MFFKSSDFWERLIYMTFGGCFTGYFGDGRKNWLLKTHKRYGDPKHPKLSQVLGIVLRHRQTHGTQIASKEMVPQINALCEHIECWFIYHVINHILYHTQYTIHIA